jgi:hypothetical protein
LELVAHRERKFKETGKGDNPTNLTMPGDGGRMLIPMTAKKLGLFFITSP